MMTMRAKWRTGLALLLALAFGTGPARAETDTVDGVEWVFSVSNGTATVTDVNLPEGESELAIPPSLGGYPVTGIGEAAFCNWEGLLAVAIPDSVTDIGDYAFSHCIALTNLELPDSVTNIGDYVFQDCGALTNVTLGSSLERIGKYAFYGCHGLVRLAIPASVVSMGSYPFSYCQGLTEIDVDENNPNYASVDGVLFTNDLTRLIWCPDAKAGSFTVPDGTRTIGTSAFQGSTNLASVTIPESVTSVRTNAFHYCLGLARLNVPASWEGTDMLARAGLDSMLAVVYGEVPEGAAAEPG